MKTFNEYVNRRATTSREAFALIDAAMKKLDENLSEDCECVFCDEAFHQWLEDFDIFDEPLLEFIENDVSEYNSLLSEAEASGVGEIKAGSVLGVWLFGPYWLAWRAIGALTSKYKRKCGAISLTHTRTACILQGKIEVANKKKKVLAKGAAASAKKNPKKAQDIKKKAQEAIRDLDEKIKEWSKKLKTLGPKAKKLGVEKGKRHFGDD